jgi:hypothetical protein
MQLASFVYELTIAVGNAYDCCNTQCWTGTISFNFDASNHLQIGISTLSRCFTGEIGRII